MNDLLVRERLAALEHAVTLVSCGTGDRDFLRVNGRHSGGAKSATFLDWLLDGYEIIHARVRLERIGVDVNHVVPAIGELRQRGVRTVTVTRIRELQA